MTMAVELDQFTGTEGYWYNPLYKSMRYTDGVKYFADKAQAHWLLDIIGTEYFPKTRGERPIWDYFLSIKMHVEDSSAQLTVTDGNDITFVVKKLFTDCPEGTYRFYLTDDVLMLASEY